MDGLLVEALEAFPSEPTEQVAYLKYITKMAKRCSAHAHRPLSAWLSVMTLGSGLFVVVGVCVCVCVSGAGEGMRLQPPVSVVGGAGWGCVP
jgi:hypothetical protein